MRSYIIPVAAIALGLAAIAFWFLNSSPDTVDPVLEESSKEAPRSNAQIEPQKASESSENSAHTKSGKERLNEMKARKEELMAERIAQRFSVPPVELVQNPGVQKSDSPPYPAPEGQRWVRKHSKDEPLLDYGIMESDWNSPNYSWWELELIQP